MVRPVAVSKSGQREQAGSLGRRSDHIPSASEGPTQNIRGIRRWYLKCSLCAEQSLPFDAKVRSSLRARYRAGRSIGFRLSVTMANSRNSLRIVEVIMYLYRAFPLGVLDVAKPSFSVFQESSFASSVSRAAGFRIARRALPLSLVGKSAYALEEAKATSEPVAGRGPCLQASVLALLPFPLLAVPSQHLISPQHSLQTPT